MKRLIAVFLAAMLAMNMIACDAGELTPEQIEIITKAVDGVNDELDNGDLEERWEEFSANLHPEELELHWDRLTVEDYETLGIDMEQLQQAGLVIDELGINEIDPSAINLSQLRLGDLRGLGQKNLEVLGYGGITLADLEALGILSAIDLSKMDLSTEELIALLSDMSPENLMKIGLNKMDFGDFGANLIMNLYLNGMDLDALGLGDIDLSGIDFAALLNGFDLSSIDLSGIDFSQIDFSDLDLSGLDPAVLDLVLLNLGGLDMSNLDLSALNLDSLNLEGLDLSDLNLDGFDLGELDPAILELVLLNLGGVDFSDIDLDSLDLDSLDLSGLDIGSLMANGVDLSVLDPALLEEIDLDDLDLSVLDLDSLDMSRIDWSNVDWDQVDLDISALDLDNIDPSSLDFSALDLSALPLEDLSIEDLEILGIDDADISALNLGDIDFNEIDPEDLDFSEMTVGDLAAFGITVEDLEDAGLVPDDIAGDITVLFSDYLDESPEVSVSLTADDEKAAEDLAIAITKLAEDKESAEDLAIEFSKMTDDEIEAMLGLSEPKKDDKKADDKKDDKKADKKDDKKVDEKKDDKKADEEIEEKKAEEEPEEAAEEEVAEEETEATEEPEEVTEGIVADEDGYVTFLPEKKPDLKDDFYASIDYDVLQDAQIPVGYSQWSPIVQSRVDTDAQIVKIVTDAQKAMKDADPDDPEYRIGALYETLLDMDARNEAGVEPIQDWIDAYEDAEDLDDLLEADLTYAEDTMFSNILSFSIDYNPEDANHYIIKLESGMYGPAKEIMIGDGMDQYRDAYLVYLGEQFRGAGYNMVDSVMMGAAAYALQTDYEEHTLSPQDAVNPSVTTNLFTQKELEKKFNNLPIAEIFAALGIDEENGYEIYQVPDLAAMEYMNSIYNEDSFEMIKANAIQKLIQRYSGILTQELFDSSLKFSNTVSGVTETQPFEEMTAQMVEGALYTEVGMLYADRYCSEEAKEEVEQMVDEIMEAYHGMIENNEWMDDETREKALEKLDEMQVNVAYPDRWYNDAKDAKIRSVEDGGTAFENCLEISKAMEEEGYRQAKGKVKRSRWEAVSPQTVNAFYNPGQNSLFICAAIMQNAMYDPDADYATNLGGIGYVIAHEISHAFDSSGSQYDADGNLNDWWTKEDWKAFNERADEVRDYYSQYVVIPGTDVCVDGNLTITENLADLGALKAIEAVCDGDTEMFEKAAENVARVWANKISQNSLQLLLSTDVHSPAKARVNVPLQMTDIFYDTFDVEEGDGMYVAPDERIGIW